MQCYMLLYFLGSSHFCFSREMPKSLHSNLQWYIISRAWDNPFRLPWKQPNTMLKKLCQLAYLSGIIFGFTVRLCWFKSPKKSILRDRAMRVLVNKIWEGFVSVRGRRQHTLKVFSEERGSLFHLLWPRVLHFFVVAMAHSYPVGLWKYQ